MKATLLAFLLAVAAFAADNSVSGPLGPTLESWRQAMLHKDAATLEKLYHKDLVYTHSSALTENKSQAIAAVVKAPPKVVTIHSADTHVYGNTATVKAKIDITNAQDAASKLDILMVFVKTGSDWQLVARQATKLP
jgi:ketosteroid isomerase-like protein